MASGKIMGMKTETVILLALGGVAVLYFMNKPSQPLQPAGGIRYVPPIPSSAATTAAEVAAGAGVVTTALNDLFGPSSTGGSDTSSSWGSDIFSDQSGGTFLAGVYNDGEN